MFKSIVSIIFITCSFCYYWTLHYTMSYGNEIQFTWGRQSNTGVSSLKSAFSMVNNGQEPPFYSIHLWCHPMTSLHHDISRVHLLQCIPWYTSSVSITYFKILHSMSHNVSWAGESLCLLIDNILLLRNWTKFKSWFIALHSTLLCLMVDCPRRDCRWPRTSSSSAWLTFLIDHPPTNGIRCLMGWFICLSKWLSSVINTSCTTVGPESPFFVLVRILITFSKELNT